MRPGIKNMLICLAFAVLTTGCGMHYMVDGKVVDAVTHQPVEDAVVAIRWVRSTLSPPGLPLGHVDYGTSESITDVQGQFGIPKYPFAHYYMGVYKQGYVCWSSEAIYHPEAKTIEEKYVRRSHKVHNGMIVELSPIQGEDFPVIEHATFVTDVNGSAGGLNFGKATRRERGLKIQHLQKLREKDK